MILTTKQLVIFLSTVSLSASLSLKLLPTSTSSCNVDDDGSLLDDRLVVLLRVAEAEDTTGETRKARQAPTADPSTDDDGADESTTNSNSTNPVAATEAAAAPVPSD